MRAGIEKKIDELRLGERVRMIGWHSAVQDLLASADVFILATHKEGLPGALAEAMAAAVPVIATDIGPTRELIEDGSTGLLVPPKNPAALAKAIEWVRDNPTDAAQMAQRARAAIARFDLTSTAKGYDRLCSDLLSA